MAYAAVSSVLRTLEYFLPFLSMVLRIWALQIRKFNEKLIQLKFASDFDSIMKCITEVRDEADRIESHNLKYLAESTASNFLKEITERLVFDIYQRKQEMSEKMEGRLEEITGMLLIFRRILEEIQLFETELKKLFEKIHADQDFASLSADLCSSQKLSIISILPFVPVACKNIKGQTAFLHEKAMIMMNLCRDLCFFLAFLRDSANICKSHKVVKTVEKSILFTANNIEDYLEKHLFTLESCLNTLIVNGFEVSPIQVIFRTVLVNILGRPSPFPYVEKIKTIKEKVRSKYDETRGSRSFQSESISRKVSRLSLENIVVGLSDITDEIVDRLTRPPSKLEIVTMVGMGGIGKTTLARKVFDHPSTVYHFHCRAWVTVSHVYQVRDLLLSLLLSVTQLTDEIYEKKKEDLAECLYRSLKGRRYLIVMDDIWNNKAWDDVKMSLPDDENGSRLLLTSRLKSVAVSVNPFSPPICMNLLSMDESWKLLEQKVFVKESCPVELMDIGKQIVKKCQGLPLAIVVVAGYLSQIKKTYQCWKAVSDNVSSLVISNPEESQAILALSYDFLPHQLKACFLYMGAFPEDGEIEAEKLINLWIAEGFVDSKSSKSFEEVGEDILEELNDRSLVLVGKRSFSGKIKTCHLHDLLRELCLREAQNVKFMHVMKRDAQGFPLSSHKQRRLSFHFDFCGDVYLLPQIPLMRSFLCFSLGSHFSPDIFFLHLKFMLLRVLDMGFLRFDNFPSQILKLVRLRYLALTATHEIPSSISELRNLQTLIIHGPWIIKQHGESPTLSLAYWDMPWLRHLRTSEASCLRVPSIDRKDLAYNLAPGYLQTLSKVRVSCCTDEVFAVMPHLKKLVICETREDYIAHQSFKCLCNLTLLQQLETLKCSFYAQSRVLRRLDYMVPLPSNIRQITFCWSNLPWNDLRLIAMLPKLEVLKLKNYAFRGPEWSPAEDGFNHLKCLLIEKTDLKHWNASSFHFPRLQRLVLRSCDFLEEIPFSVGEIPTLELIELHHCCKSAEVSAQEIKEQFDGVEVRIQCKPIGENHP